jgi:biopolymer transport protein ExbD
MKPTILLLVLIITCLCGCSTTAPRAPAPEKQQPQQAVDNLMVDRVTVSVDAAGNISIENEKLELSELSEKIQTSPVIIRANTATPFKTVQEIMSKLAEEGVTDIIFATFDEK